jgi:hypothetical protein
MGTVFKIIGIDRSVIQALIVIEINPALPIKTITSHHFMLVKIITKMSRGKAGLFDMFLKNDWYRDCTTLSG